MSPEKSNSLLRDPDSSLGYYSLPVPDLLVDQQTILFRRPARGFSAKLGECLPDERFFKRFVNRDVQSQNRFLWCAALYRKAYPILDNKRRKAGLDDRRYFTERWHALRRSNGERAQFSCFYQIDDGQHGN